MHLIKLNDDYVDASKITYLGKVDTIIKSHINSQIYYFSIVVDGVLLKIEGKDKKNAIDNWGKVRNFLESL